MGNLQGQTAVITGAAQGLGYAIAKAYVAEGMKVALMDVRGDILENVADECRAMGGDVLPITVDLADAAQTQAAIDAALATYGTPPCAHPQRGLANHALNAGNHAGQLAEGNQYHLAGGFHPEQSGLETDDRRWWRQHRLCVLGFRLQRFH